MAALLDIYGHDTWTYLKNALERLFVHPNHRIDETSPRCWKLANVKMA